MSETLTATLVCEACRMKLPSETHAKAHLIVHGNGHEPHVAMLDSTGTSK